MTKAARTSFFLSWALALCSVPCPGQTSPPLVVRSLVPTDTAGTTFLQDLNGDRRPDLITATSSGYAVRLNDGSGKFPSPAVLYPYNKSDGDLLIGSHLAADFNQDGRPDLLAITNLGIYLYAGDGKGGLGAGQRMSIRTDVRGTDAATGDFNGDGIPDFATTLGGGSVRLFLGTGKGDFREGTLSTADVRSTVTVPRVQARDLDGDGFSDLLTIDALERSISILLNNRSGGFRLAQVIQGDIYTRPQGVITGDFNRDGKIDLVIIYFRALVTATNITFDNPVELWTQDTTGTFTKAATIPAGQQSLNGLASADVNGDGNLDLIVSGATNNVYFGDGTGKFGKGVPVDSGQPMGTSGPVLTADLDGDGKSEVVFISPDAFWVVGIGQLASQVTLYRNLNPFTFRMTEVFTVTVEGTTPMAGFPTGTVTLYDGGQPVAMSLLFNGSAHFSVPFLPGKHLFHAEYGGDCQYSAGYADLAVTEAGPPAVITGSASPAFVAQVLDAGGNPVSGVGVIFSVPLIGPSGTFLGQSMALVITDMDGIAHSPAFVPNTILGQFLIRLTVSGYPGIVGSFSYQNL